MSKGLAIEYKEKHKYCCYLEGIGASGIFALDAKPDGPKERNKNGFSCSAGEVRE